MSATASHSVVETTGPRVTLRVASRRPRRWVASVTAATIAVLWTIPTLGLLVTSFRPQAAIQESGWWTALWHWDFVVDNYRQVLTGPTARLSDYLVNSVVITVPAVVLPMALACLAAYAFAWGRFRGRNALFVAVFTLQIVPLQVALIPLLSLYVQVLHIQGTFWCVWLTHTVFALPFATFLLRNFMVEIPQELLEAAQIDGASHVRTLLQIVLPLIRPALAAFGIFQFLWVWNDLLVSLTFLGDNPSVAPLTVRVAELSGSYGSSWYLLSAGAFVSILLPLLVFLSLQRFFVRGLMAGGLKG
jgi:alpha-glucoside transport system permease protein